MGIEEWNDSKNGIMQLIASSPCGYKEVWLSSLNRPVSLNSSSSSMYEDHFRDPEAGEDYGMASVVWSCTSSVKNSPRCITDRPRDQFMSAPNQRRPAVFVDSSGPLFSMYSKAAEEEDMKMIESWRKDANEILIFVSPRGQHFLFM
jgi:hypothetical protein